MNDAPVVGHRERLGLGITSNQAFVRATRHQPMAAALAVDADCMGVYELVRDTQL